MLTHKSVFFIKTIPEETAGRTRKVKSILGELPITEKQVNKLKLKPRTQMINILEKNCLPQGVTERLKSLLDKAHSR